MDETLFSKYKFFGGINMFSNTSRSITKAELKAIELELGITFPHSFVEHYLLYNGGIPSETFFYSEITDIETEIQIFSPIKYKFNNIDIRTVEEKYELFKKKSILMSDYLPFANDYGSNQICISLKDNKVYIVYMDMGELSQECFKYLANDFDEFINGLSCESIDD